MEKRQNLHTLRRLYSLTNKAGIWLFVCVFLLLFCELATLGANTIVGMALDRVVSGTGIPLSLALILVGAITVFIGISGMGTSYALERARNLATYYINKETIGHTVKLPASFYDQNPTGELMSKLMNDMGILRKLFGHPGRQVFVGSILTVVTLGYMLWQNWIVGSVNVLLVFGLMALNNTLSTRYKSHQKHVMKKLEGSNAIANDTFQGIREAKAFNRTEDMKASYEEKIAEVVQYRVSIAKLSAFMEASALFAQVVPQMVTFALGGYFVFTGRLPIGTVLALEMNISVLTKSLGYLMRSYGVCAGAIGATERILDVLDTDTEEDLWSTRRESRNRENAESVFEIRDLIFSYDGQAETRVLDGVNLLIARGEKVALVGESGCGKTTLIKLLAGFYKPTAGTIFFRGQRMGSLALEDVRKDIAMVGQDPFLFPVTIYENIGYGGMQHQSIYEHVLSYDMASPVEPDEEIMNAAKDAQIHEFIVSLPNGYNSLVGERGVKLSGGQQQRVCIARAMLKDASILLLDEPTSALDTHLERQISDLLGRLSEEKTTITVAHRLSSIKNVDRILVMEKGRIVEEGTHDSLMKQQGLYYSLYSQQTLMNQEKAVI